MKAEEFKFIVREKYGEIARRSVLQTSSSCCGTSGCCSDQGFSMIGDDYQNLEGYNPDADLGLGCGVPTQFAGISRGDHALDLGSGDRDLQHHRKCCQKTGIFRGDVSVWRTPSGHI